MDSLHDDAARRPLGSALSIFPADYQADGTILVPRTTRADRHLYSDGDAVEAQIGAIVDGLQDRSSLSPELAEAIADWPTLYHLSPKRGNLLRPFAADLRGKRVLEVGAGCGAITRYLGETAGSVVAIESSAQRARIARARTADLANVTVVHDDIFQFGLEEPVDVVLLIGVLEYARLFYKGPGQAEAALLAHLAGLLRPDGLLLLAIENRFGLKYFAGAPEDHVGRPFFGISDNYTGDTPATFGRRELRRLLGQAGFRDRRLYLPFPDYKLPSVVISPEGAQRRDFAAGDLAAETVHSDPQPFAGASFPLQKVWPLIDRNGLLREMANSFIFAARFVARDKTESGGQEVLAWHFALDRQPAFMKETRFIAADGAVQVHRIPLHGDAVATHAPIHHDAADEAYLGARNWWFRLVDILARPGWTLDELTAWAGRWTEALLARLAMSPAGMPQAGMPEAGMPEAGPETPVRGTLFDASPFNFLVDAEGVGVFIDQEWEMDRPLPLGFILARGVRESLRRVVFLAPPADLTLDTVDRITQAVLGRLGFLITPTDLARYADLELLVQAWVGGKELPPRGRDLLTTFRTPLVWHRDAVEPAEPAEAAEPVPPAPEPEDTSALHEALRVETDRSQDLLLTVGSLQEEIGGLRGTAASLQEEIGDLRSRLAADDAALALTVAEAARLRGELPLLAGNANRLRREAQRIDRLRRETADALAAAQGRAAEQAGEITRLAGVDHQLATIQSSTTWRIALRLIRIADRHPRLIRLLRGAAKLLLWTARGQLRDRLRRRRAIRAAEPQPAPMVAAVPPPPAPPSPKEAMRASLQAELAAFLASGENLILPPLAGVAPRLSVLIVLFGKAYFTLACLRALAIDLEPGAEIIVVDNGSTDETGALLDRLDNVRVFRNPENLGFLRGANTAAALATGDYLLFLNNDAFPRPGALQAARMVLDADPQAGAVAARLVRPDRRLQEAGSIVWRDGTTEGYARGRPADAPEALFRRQVDYGSGAFLMTRRDAFERLGGFDPRYAPAYYEDSDYCLRLAEIGLATIYEPMAVVDHFEFGSDAEGGQSKAEALMHRNRAVFRARHAAALARHLPAGEGNRFAGREAPQAARPHLLLIEERVPHRPYGAGFPRLLGMVEGMLALGWAVTLLPVDEPEIDWEGAYTELDRRVEILPGGLPALAVLKADRARAYDVIFISRPNNMQRFRAAEAELGLDLTGTRIVYDAEAFAALREIERRRILGDAMSDAEAHDLIAAEAALAQGAESVTAVSAAEAALFERETGLPATVLSDTTLPASKGADFAARAGFLFVGRLLETDSPNYDSLRWFVQNVWPLLRALIGEVTLTVAGPLFPGAPDLQAPGVLLLDRVDDLDPLYAAARIFIAPTRFAAGLPHKVVEATAAGLPTVATPLIARQLGWVHGEAIMSAEEPEAFAEACAALYQDEALWRRVRDTAQAELAAAHSGERFLAALARVLKGEG